MRRIVFHRHAAKYLQKMPADRKSQILGAVKNLATALEPLSGPNVKAMAGEWEGAYRLRVGSYRVIFSFQRKSPPEPESPEELVEVLLIGPRGDVYK